jgi:hypothetical protein
MAWRHTGEWRYNSTILDLGTRWRRVVNFTPRSLYLREYRPRYPLDGPQSRYGLYGEVKNISMPGIEPGPSSPYLNRLQELSIACSRANGTSTFAKCTDLMATTVPHLTGGATQMMISRNDFYWIQFKYYFLRCPRIHRNDGADAAGK